MGKARATIYVLKAKNIKEFQINEKTPDYLLVIRRLSVAHLMGFRLNFVNTSDS